MKLKLILTLFSGINLLAFSQSLSEDENRLYKNYENYAEIMWILEQEKPCIPNTATFALAEGYGNVMVKTNYAERFPEDFWLFNDIVFNTTTGGGNNSFYQGLIYKKNSYLFHYNENNQITKMDSDYVKSHNVRKNGKIVKVYYYTTTYDIAYTNGVMSSITETHHAFKNPKKPELKKSLVVRTIELSGITDSTITKKELVYSIEEEDLTLKLLRETWTKHEYLQNNSYRLSYYRPDGTAETETLTTYTVKRQPESVITHSFLPNGDVTVDDRFYYYNGAEGAQSALTVTWSKNGQPSSKTLYDYVNDTEERFNANGDLIFEKKNGMFRTRENIASEWSEWKDYRFCIN